MIAESESGQITELRIHEFFVDQLALQVDVAALQLDDFRSISRIAQYVAARPDEGA